MGTLLKINGRVFEINNRENGIMKRWGKRKRTKPKPEPEQHEYVDLGLSVKWATCNIGANTPEEAGLYFAWGETSGYTAEQVGNGEGKRAFSWDDYEFGPDSALTKYSETDGKTVLDAEDDAAKANWGLDWRMPTKAEFEELISSANTTTAFTEQNGVSGLLVTSKVEGYEGNSVFFPAVGDAADGRVFDVGGYGNYWSVSLYDGGVYLAWRLDFRDGNCGVSGSYRCYGCSVRPVRFQNL
jgi:hypothetical protein